MHAKPVIGVVPLVDYGRESYWMLPGYLDGIAEAGGLPLTLPLTNDPDEIAQLVGMLDGLLVTGGQDVAPALYGDTSPEAAALCAETSPERDAMEAVLIPAALAADLPMLGICRGIQVINALLGGTLWQDLPTQRPSDVEHHGNPPYDQPVHRVAVLAGTPLAELIRKLEMTGAAPDGCTANANDHPVDANNYPDGTRTLAVNSYHHQAVRTLAPGLEPMAIAPDGIIEALWRPASRWLWAVQWHPEFSRKVDPTSRAIFSALVGAANTSA